MLPKKDRLLYSRDLYSRGRFKGEFHEMDRKVLFDGLQNLKGYFTCALMVHGNLKWLNVYSGNPYRNTPVIFSTV